MTQIKQQLLTTEELKKLAKNNYNFEGEELENILKAILKNNFINGGSEATIYALTEDLALRLIKDDEFNYSYNYAHKPFKGHKDEGNFINKLKARQEDILLTEFPITNFKIQGEIMGQIIHYYRNSTSLKKFLKENKDDVDPIFYYISIIDIVEELANHGINPKDIHGGNFIVTEDGEIKMIDFSTFGFAIDEIHKGMYFRLLQNFEAMINNLNKEIFPGQFDKINLSSEIKNNTDTVNINEIFELLREKLEGIEITKNQNRTQ